MAVKDEQYREFVRLDRLTLSEVRARVCVYENKIKKHHGSDNQRLADLELSLRGWQELLLCMEASAKS